MTLPYDLAQEMRYGENPHQKAAFYRTQFCKLELLPMQNEHTEFFIIQQYNDANAAISILKELMASVPWLRKTRKSLWCWYRRLFWRHLIMHTNPIQFQFLVE